MPRSQQLYPPLPEGFLFGVATADHQCEAYDPDNQDIRDVWEQRCRLKTRGQATDFWTRYAEDIELARGLGCKAFRFSLSWSRLEPEQGTFNEEAFAHYRQMIETIHAAGMQPVMTLHHFTWPVHVEARGGLIGENFPTIFADYVTQVVKRLGPEVHYWITFNEPTQLIYGYIKPWWEQNYFMPPGLPAHATMTDQLEAVGKLIKNLFLAHTAARNVIKGGNPEALVGVNPMLLGLPPWLQRLVDRNITRLRSPEDWQGQGQRFADRGWLERGKVDLAVATLTLTSERARQVDFSEVYYTASQALLLPVESPVQEPGDLAGKTVAVVKGSTSEDTIGTLLPNVSVRVVKTYPDALHALDHGQVAAILADDTILPGLMQPPGRYRLSGQQLTTEPYAVAMAKGDPEFVEAVDRAIRNFKDSGAWATSFARHFPGQPVPPPPQLATRTALNDINGMQFAQNTAGRSRRKTQLERIRARGHLVVAVKEDVPGFGYRDPQTGELTGLEIDLARAIAQEICGDPGKIVFRPTGTGERLQLLHSALHAFDPLFKLYAILSTALTSNWWHLGMAGKLPTFLCPPECVGQQDFVGFDYYWGISTLHPHRIQRLMDAMLGRYNLAPVWPEALYAMLKYHARLFPEQEILIIENGCVDQTDGVDRAQYISRHVRQVQRAHRDGVKVRTYICWSITSNREWGLHFGSGSDFGLYHINLDTDAELRRMPTPAVQVYQKIIENRGAV